MLAKMLSCSIGRGHHVARVISRRLTFSAGPSTRNAPFQLALPALSSYLRGTTVGFRLHDINPGLARFGSSSAVPQAALTGADAASNTTKASAPGSDSSSGAGASSSSRSKSHSGSQTNGSDHGSHRRRRLLRLLKWLPLALFASKVIWAMTPYWLAEPLRAPESVRKLLEKHVAERTPVGWGWLIHEASDRLVRDVYVAIACVVDYIRNGPKTADWSVIHQRAADRILKLCETNRGVYVKLGQHVGQLAYLLPPEYVNTLAVLTHAAPMDTWEQVQAVFAEETGRAITDVFEDVDPVPIASASLAQVHVAYMRGTREKVAIKVQHAGLRETCDADIQMISALAHLVKAIFPKFDYVWLATETEDNLPKELNFLVEAANAERQSAAFAHRNDVVCPRIAKELSSPRVLVMSFEDGVYINKKASIEAMGLAPADVARIVSEVFAEQIFLNGFVHCDPHPANVLVRAIRGKGGKPTPQLVLLDHGLYRDISRIRLDYAHLWRAILNADVKGMERYAGRLNAGPLYPLLASMLTTRTWDSIVNPELDDAARLQSMNVKGKKEEFDETRRNAAEYSEEISAILRALPRELLLILKTNDCLRNVDLSLGCPINNLVITARYTQRAINRERTESSGGGWLAWLANTYDSLLLEAKLGAFSSIVNVARWFSRDARVKVAAEAAAAFEAATSEEEKEKTTAAVSAAAGALPAAPAPVAAARS